MVVITTNMYAGNVSLKKSMPIIVKSKVFSINNCYGFKISKSVEMLYQNPRVAGGAGATIFWDPVHSFHCHPPGH